MTFPFLFISHEIAKICSPGCEPKAPPDKMKNQYIHPRNSFLSKPFNWLCNQTTIRRTRRAIFSRLPFLRLESDVTDIVYVNWLVDIEKVKALSPPQVELVEINGKTVFSILTYQHGHFRPRLINVLKRLFPSPIQSNWRLYVASINGKQVTRAVLFIKNMMNSMLFTLGTRLSSDAMFTHYPLNFRHDKSGHHYTTTIETGMSSSPDLQFSGEIADELELPSELVHFFGSTAKTLEFLCLQDVAYTDVSDTSGICEATISLPIALDTIIPLKVNKCHSNWLAEIISDAPAFAFAVPRVPFHIINETLIRDQT